jgi:predicted 3-demethylubiquinone-9 3-methyltransferase (glyoxalase superfamily)
MTERPLVTCLWFDTQAEEAATFYTGIFPGAKLGAVHRYTAAGPGPEGDPMLVEFELNGQKFSALNGGPQFTFDEAISIVVPCADQAEVDYYWDRLVEGGEPSQCGWLKDKYGMSWQVVPKGMAELFADPDKSRAERAMKAMFTMTKIDVAALERAANDVAAT